MSGYLYCLYNDAFERFKRDPLKNNPNEEVYKLGRTCNVANRLASYSTYYIKPSKMLYVSSKFKDSVKAERVLFHILRNYRVTNKREFFRCDLQTIKETFDRMSDFTDIMIDEMYKAIIGTIFPEDIVERIEKGGGFNDAKVIPNDEWFMYEKGNMDSIKAFLEQYRFKPIHPEMFPGYSHITPAFSEVIRKVSPNVKMLKPPTVNFVFVEDHLDKKFEELKISS